MLIFRILSVELLLLIATVFLMVYITKQQVSKWFTYGSRIILIGVILMMACTLCCAICMHHCGMHEMKPGKHHHKMMLMHNGGHMSRMEQEDEGEEMEEMEACEINGEGCDRPCCKNGMHEGKQITKEIRINKGDSVTTKTVIIK